MKIKKGDAFPDAKVFILEKDPKEISIKEIVGYNKVILFGLPGAFTPTCSAKHLPGYVNNFQLAQKKGVNKIICISVNDPNVMDAWGESQKVEDKIIMVGDPYCEFTKMIGAEVDKYEKGLGIRSSRYTMLVENGEVKKIAEEKETATCELSAAESFLKSI